MTIGDRILEIIKQKGFTQMEFSKLTGIPQSTLSSWRSRKQNPGIDKLQVICDTLGVDPYYLISGTDAENTGTGKGLTVYDDGERTLVLSFRSLKEAQKNRLLGYLAALKAAEEQDSAP